jgi:ATP-dependent DNA helicase RecQ
LSCRRKIFCCRILTGHRKNCGNCDICKSPPAFFWRYHNSSKVLSAIIRLQSRNHTRNRFSLEAPKLYIFEKRISKSENIWDSCRYIQYDYYIIQLINRYCEIKLSISKTK